MMKNKIINLSYMSMRNWSLKVGSVLMCCFALISCSDYLDVVPDDVATLEDAFKLRANAEKYLNTCYSYMPQNGNLDYNIGLTAGDEIWWTTTIFNPGTFFIKRGAQQVANPFMNAWEGRGGYGPEGNYSSSLGVNTNHFGLYRAIRECNTFLENVSNPENVVDIEELERIRWLAEVKFLKAYYHFYLLRMYGAIPIVRQNLPLSASPDEVQVMRDPVDEAVDYIVELLDEAAEDLPAIITVDIGQYGRATKVIALGLKAKVLLMAASPLFNGNTDMADLRNPDGTQLFNQTYDPTKWAKAADAARAAIDEAHAQNFRLYKFTDESYPIGDTIKTELSLRRAVTDRDSDEVLWANTQSFASEIQIASLAPLDPGHNTRDAQKYLAAPIKIAKQFYSANGVPINEDKTYDFSDIAQERVAERHERFHVKEGESTARINFDREPRFYASLCFDRGIWYKEGKANLSDTAAFHLEARLGEYGGSSHTWFYNSTGYYIKKLVDIQTTTVTGARGILVNPYAWPEMRLADLYLMYAEALNESDAAQAQVFEYLDLVRERAGLNGAVESWQNFSNNPAKVTTKDGRREIIHQERLIELAFEGHRYWDLLRWKKAVEELNKPITAWNYKGKDYVSYYQEVTQYNQEFIAPRDYFWPLSAQSLLENTNLVQNIGW